MRAAAALALQACILQCAEAALAVEAWHARRWPVGEAIRYYVATESTSRDEPALHLERGDARIAGAVAHWEQRTCIRFVRCNGTEADCAKPYIRFVSHATKCSSRVGMDASRVNEIRISPECETGGLVHEIAHSLGLGHEQNRFDRGQHVSIDAAEIKRSAQHNFAEDRRAHALGIYDYKSIMHYNTMAFAVGNKPTIIAPESVGQKVGLSHGDVAAIHFMYHFCEPRFTAPSCLASAGTIKPHRVEPGEAFEVEFNGLYGGMLSVGYEKTTAPGAQTAFGVPAGTEREGHVATRVRFIPEVGDVGETYTLAATFTGTADRVPTTCAVRVAVVKPTPTQRQLALSTRQHDKMSVKATSGTISDGYDTKYALGVFQTVTVRGARCRVQWTHMDVEGQHGCSYDYVEVRDGAVSVGKFCGAELPGPMVLEGTEFTVTFMSDRVGAQSGFELAFVCDGDEPAAPAGAVSMRADSGRRITAATGTITADGSDAGAAVTIVGRTCTLTWRAVSFPSRDGACDGYVAVAVGDVLAAQVCGTAPPPPLHLTGAEFTVSLHNRSGDFALDYTCHE
eukprot:TRINITY_DN16264_c0_g2_i1.p1 TRINITY_DN16264_c0_g2~~TRINITY_DN16264_c0_g2_i1.p1  ORF type:complete len:567 (+),score=138.18 TRINITY_DN16264_c0_g2_i1:49-1749(+)